MVDLQLVEDGRRGLFYNVWGGRIIRPGRFRRDLADDLSSVFALVRDGTIRPHVAARIPLSQAARAMALAESGKVVLVP